MALKPRTFRRILLASALVTVVALVAIAYFVVRPMRSQHMLEDMRVEGIAAAEAGDYVQAEKQIGRYIKSTQDPDPELILTYARARLKVRTGDGGYVVAAIASYRDYLKAVPDDGEVSKELLPLFNLVGMNLEAKNLAQSLRTKFNDQSIEVLREERRARENLDRDDPLIEQLFDLSLANPDAAFSDLFEYTEWLRRHDRFSEATALIAARKEAGQVGVDTQLLELWVDISQQSRRDNPESNNVSVEKLAAILGLDPVLNQWKAEPEYFTPVVVSLVDRLFNGLGRPDLSLSVRVASAKIMHDSPSMEWAARRLYWNHDFERLFEVPSVDNEGAIDPDVLGYQILAYRRMDDLQGAAPLIEQLGEIVLDFRAGAWLGLFEGEKLLKEGDVVEARQVVKSAIGGYTLEPYFHLVMGDVHAKQGRIKEAEKEWLKAQRLVIDVVGNVGWIEPNIRIIRAYTNSGRLAEALKYVNELVLIAPQNMTSTVIWLQSYAALARSGDLDRSRIEGILGSFEKVQDSFSPEQNLVISPQIATLYASIDRDEDARALLARAFSSSPSPEIMLSLLDVDQRFDLGVADAQGIDTSGLGSLSPQRALQFALLESAKSNEVDKGLAIIDRASANASSGGEADDPYAWGLVRARYLDISKDPRASGAWDELHEQYPDNVDLLYQIAESDAFGSELRKVNEIIDEIVTLTKTAGKPLPSRLRLAKASAIIRNTQTRASRQDAIEIVRTVVASEPQNVVARNMLGQILAMKPAFGLKPDDTFKPDFEGAIDQYVTIARQIEGKSAQNYLLESVDLSIESNNLEQAEQYLLEFDSRFKTSYALLPAIAQRFENLNDPENARVIYSRVYQNAQDTQLRIDAGLSLANLLMGPRQRQQIGRVLDALGNEPELSVDQLVKLASLNSKSGRKTRGDELAESGERYKLDPVESKMVYARYASAFISGEEYVSTLKEIVAVDPTNEDAWKQLVGKFVRDQEFVIAQELAAQALVSLPESKELQALAILAEGEPESASSLIDAGVVESTKINIEAVKQVDDYVLAEKTESKEELAARLILMLDAFPKFPPIQRFALPKFASLGLDPKQVALYADRAGRVMPYDSVVMGIAANAYLRARSPSDALRVANLWRANIPGSPMGPDMATAQAMIQFENYADAAQTLLPYVQAAFEDPSKPANIEIIHVYSHVQLLLGEDPEKIADRLFPLLEANPVIRTRVWIGLATESVPTQAEAARWIERLTPYATADEMPAIANAWLAIIEKYNAFVTEYATRAIKILQPIVAADPEDAEASSALSLAYYDRARGSESKDLQDLDFEQALGLLDRGDERDPSNLYYLAQGARVATDAKDFEGAEFRYRKLLERDLGSSPFSASMKNNLAMLIERKSSDPKDLEEALELAGEAVQSLDVPPFWGTKGWVELALNQLEAAESSFEHAVELEPKSVEGWVGLAIVQHQLGPERAEDSERSFNRVRGFIEAGSVDEELLDRLRNQGDSQWASVLVP